VPEPIGENEQMAEVPNCTGDFDGGSASPSGSLIV
jgi:hypothetical protein